MSRSCRTALLRTRRRGASSCDRLEFCLGLRYRSLDHSFAFGELKRSSSIRKTEVSLSLKIHEVATLDFSSSRRLALISQCLMSSTSFLRQSIHHLSSYPHERWQCALELIVSSLGIYYSHLRLC